jgi:hypothetical protein
VVGGAADCLAKLVLSTSRMPLSFNIRIFAHAHAAPCMSWMGVSCTGILFRPSDRNCVQRSRSSAR